MCEATEPTFASLEAVPPNLDLDLPGSPVDPLVLLAEDAEVSLFANFQHDIDLFEGTSVFEKTNLCDDVKVANIKKKCKVPNIKKKCNKCEKSFTQLSKHMNACFGLQPFHCRHCEKKFSQKSNLNRHVVSFHSEKSYKCEVCQKTIKRKDKWKEHIVKCLPPNFQI